MPLRTMAIKHAKEPVGVSPTVASDDRVRILVGLNIFAIVPASF